MANTGFVVAGTGADVTRSGFGNFAWTATANVTSNDGDAAHVSFTSTGTTHWLVGSNFGLTTSDIPSGSTIDGIEARVEWQYSGTICSESAVQIDESSATSDPPSGDNKSTAANLPGSYANSTYGGTTDLWGLTISDSDVRSSDFSFWISLTSNKSGGGALVDAMWINVHYTPPASRVTIIT